MVHELTIFFPGLFNHSQQNMLGRVHRSWLVGMLVFVNIPLRRHVCLISATNCHFFDLF